MANETTLPTVILPEITEPWADEDIQAPIRVEMPLGAIWLVITGFVVPLIAVWGLLV